MRRPHPYLAVSLACAAVVLVTVTALACPASAQAWSTAPVPRRTPTPAPAAQPTCLPLIHGAIVWPGSPECTDERATDTLNVPTQERLGAIRYFTQQILWYDLRDGRLTTDATQAEQQAAWNQAGETVPTYYDRPLYGTWAATPPALPPNCGPTSWCGCASGIGTWPPKIDVSQRLGRVEQLVAWEITNAFLGSIRRPDLWDNAYVSSVVTRVGQQMGGWSQQ